MAERFRVGTLSNWNSTNNWSETSGGAAGASAPGANDDVIFDSLTPTHASNMQLATTVSCRSLIFTGWTGTFFFNGNGFFSIGANIGAAGTIPFGDVKLGSDVTYTINTNSGIIHKIHQERIPDVSFAGKKLAQYRIENNSGTDNITVGVNFLDEIQVNNFELLNQNRVDNTIELNGSNVFVDQFLQLYSSCTSKKIQGDITIFLRTNGCTFNSYSLTPFNLDVIVGANSTFNGTIYKGEGSLFQITGGTITNNATLSPVGDNTFDLAGTVFPIYYPNYSVNTTMLQSNLSATTMYFNSSLNVEFSGTGVFHANNMTVDFVNSISSNFDITLKEGLNYKVNNCTLNTFNDNYKVTIKSSLPGSPSYFNVMNTNYIPILNNVNATDINSATGTTILYYNGTATDTVNWTELTTGSTSGGAGGSYTFVS